MTITTSVTMEEYYENEYYQECPYNYNCANCWFDCEGGEEI